jgi:hypothetical protein
MEMLTILLKNGVALNRAISGKFMDAYVLKENYLNGVTWLFCPSFEEPEITINMSEVAAMFIQKQSNIAIPQMGAPSLQVAGNGNRR